MMIFYISFQYNLFHYNFSVGGEKIDCISANEIEYQELLTYTIIIIFRYFHFSFPAWIITLTGSIKSYKIFLFSSYSSLNTSQCQVSICRMNKLSFDVKFFNLIHWIGCCLVCFLLLLCDLSFVSHYQTRRILKICTIERDGVLLNDVNKAF